jgi:hypothetical protein
MKLITITIESFLGAALLAVVAAPALAAVPHIFAPGDTIRASDMNENFAAQQDAIDALQTGVCPASAATRFVDNGDGTICDNQTGLMWEQKDTSDGTQDLANPHDADNVYTWSSASSASAADGTIFTDFLARLNNTVADSASDVPFAGHTDWRLPTNAELRTLLLFPNLCSVSPCIIDDIFTPTIEGPYWTSTSSASLANQAWFVNFNLNVTVNDTGTKVNPVYVRAVRGGR